MSDARSAMLAALRDALGPATDAVVVPRAYRRGRPSSAADVDCFCERVQDYRASIHRTVEGSVTEMVSEVLHDAGAQRVAMAEGVPWRPAGVEVVEDRPPLSLRALERLDAVVTGCALAIAETGTFVLDAGDASGRRTLTLVCDHHVCVVHARQVVAGVPEAIQRLARGQPLTFVSGPSATSDIELERVEGVHGPRRLDVIVVG